MVRSRPCAVLCHVPVQSSVTSLHRVTSHPCVELGHVSTVLVHFLRHAQLFTVPCSATSLSTSANILPRNIRHCDCRRSSSRATRSATALSLSATALSKSATALSESVRHCFFLSQPPLTLSHLPLSQSATAASESATTHSQSATALTLHRQQRRTSEVTQSDSRHLSSPGLVTFTARATCIVTSNARDVVPPPSTPTHGETAEAKGWSSTSAASRSKVPSPAARGGGRVRGRGPSEGGARQTEGGPSCTEARHATHRP